VDGAGKVAQRKIAVDRAVGNMWLVGEGLAPGDQVIVEGLQKVRPGSSVKTVPFGASPPDAPAAAKPAQPAAPK
jgi:membrane fusion protein (multidrug efflux system)